MFLKTICNVIKSKSTTSLNCRIATGHWRYFSQELENKYSETQKAKILEVINEADTDTLSGYDVSKGRLKKLSQWKSSNNKAKNLSDLELVEGFNEKSAKKLFDSIVDGPPNKVEKPNKIRGQFLHPNLGEALRKSVKTVMSVYTTVNSVCWTLIDRNNYEVLNWRYYGIVFPEGKRLQIPDIFNIAWEVSQQLETADIYVMKAEATTLRATGNDPNNPKVIAVNLQKAQMVAMIVALVNARSRIDSLSDDEEESITEHSKFRQKVYFLRATLPYRLYGTLVGNEKVSTDQTVEILLQTANQKSPTNSHVYIPENFQSMFKSQEDLQKDMLGHSLLLGLTFMDLCIYKNQDSINKLAKRRD